MENNQNKQDELKQLERKDDKIVEKASEIEFKKGKLSEEAKEK